MLEASPRGLKINLGGGGGGSWGLLATKSILLWN